ncbi:MAG TPA: MlaD family protein [Kofleriaceae bacterium]|nr:MlaD family protein [Kofleriaceae bacterium]
MALAIHDERLTRRVGAAVLAIAAFTIVFVVMILPRIEHGGVDVTIHFTEATGIVEGAPVRVAGRTIGHVRTIGMATRGGIGVVIRLEGSWARRIPINSDFFVDARSPLAPRYIAIGPPPGHADPARALVDGDEVTGVDPPSLDRVLQRTNDNLTEVSDFLDTIRPATKKIDAAVDRLTATVAQVAPGVELRARMSAAIDEARALVTTLQDGGLDPAGIDRLGAKIDGCATHLGEAITELRVRVAEVRTALALAGARDVTPQLRARLTGALDSADRALASASSLADGLHGLVHDATDGHGAAAAFLSDLELVDDVKALTRDLKNRPWRVAAPKP